MSRVLSSQKILFACILLILCASVSSCKITRVFEHVPVEVHDTTYIAKVQHDSTYIDRWHTIETKGDTVYITENQITVKYRTVTDTAYKYIEKPVTVTVEQIKEVEKPIAWWRNILIWTGIVSIIVAIITFVCKHRKLIIKT